MNDLKSRLDAMVQKSENEEPAAGAAPTANFTEPKQKVEVPVDAEGIPYKKVSNPDGTVSYRERTPEEKEKYKTQQETKTKKDAICKKIGERAKLSDNEKALRAEFQATARIVGYVVAKSEKIDFSAQSISHNEGNLTADNKVIDPSKTRKTYNIILKQFGPSGIKFVMVKYRASLMGLFKTLATKSDADFASELAVAKNDTSNNYEVAYIPYSGLLEWVREHTLGYLYEADEIFTPIYKKTSGGKEVKEYLTPSSIKPNSVLPNGSYLWLSTTLAKPKFLKKKEGSETITTNELDVASVQKLKHSIRTKPVTPANCVALDRYQTVKPKTTYEASEAEKMIYLYLNRFENSTKGTPVAQNLEDALKVMVRDGKIVSTSYFATTGNPSYFAGNEGIAHWSNKTATGDAEIIPASEIALVKKATVDKGKNPNRVVAIADRLGDANDTVYGFNKETFPAVFAAGSEQLLRYSDLQAAIEANKSKKARSSKTEDKKVTFLDPSAAIGVSPDVIAQLLNAEFGG